MSYNLYLDDFREPIDSSYYLNKSIYVDLIWEVVRDFDEFTKIIIEKGIPDIISFDHDIYYDDYDFPEKTGFDCAEWFIEYCIKNNIEISTNMHIHSGNPVGSENIKKIFEKHNILIR